LSGQLGPKPAFHLAFICASGIAHAPFNEGSTQAGSMSVCGRLLHLSFSQPFSGVHQMKAHFFVPLVLASATGLASATVVNQAITEAEVLEAQKGWCKALVDISEAHASEGQAAAKALAEKVIDGAYGYQMGAVLFKPTLTVVPQTFRTTRAGALSYFVGGDNDFPKDSGFALKGWKACEAKNAAVFITGDSASTIGNVVMTDKDGQVTTVDKTWKYVKDDAGTLRIVVHHSSLPYSGS